MSTYLGMVWLSADLPGLWDVCLQVRTGQIAHAHLSLASSLLPASLGLSSWRSMPVSLGVQRGAQMDSHAQWSEPSGVWSRCRTKEGEEAARGYEDARLGTDQKVNGKRELNNGNPLTSLFKS